MHSRRTLLVGVGGLVLGATISLAVVGLTAAKQTQVGALTVWTGPHRALFAFRNLTDTPIDLTYTLRNPLPSSTTDRMAPAITSRSDTLDGWRTLSTSKFSTNDDRTEVSLTVPAGGSARIAALPSYPGHNLPGLEVFPILKLRISDDQTERSISLDGPRALLAFKRIGKVHYALTVYGLRVTEG